MEGDRGKPGIRVLPCRPHGLEEGEGGSLLTPGPRLPACRAVSGSFSVLSNNRSHLGRFVLAAVGNEHTQSNTTLHFSETLRSKPWPVWLSG